MIFQTIRTALKAAKESEQEAESKARQESLELAIRKELREYLSSLPEEERLKTAAVAVPSQEMTEALLRRFVAACPSDRVVEVVFPGGARVLINSPKGKGGPGW